jgi:glycosyltransferase involved in cell wall biosynthesis
MGRPSIGSNIYGLKDSILNGKTGILFPVGNIEKLSDAISKMAENYELRLKLAKKGKQGFIKTLEMIS